MIFRVLNSSLARSIQIVSKHTFARVPPKSVKATSPKVHDQLAIKINEEISYQEENKPSVEQYVNFFSNNGWDMKTEGTQVELIRKTGNYNIRLLFNAKNPSTANDEQQQNQDEEQFEDDYSQVSVYINKEGTTKWMCCEFFVTEQQSEIAGVRFVQDYEKERVNRFRERVTSTAYPGPQMQSLEELLTQKIAGFVESIGVDNSVLQNIANYSVAYEHEFYLNWLKDLKSVL